MFVSGWDDNINEEEDIPEEEPEDEKDIPAYRLLVAAKDNDVENLQKLLKSDASLINCTDSDKYTPLHRACYNNNVNIVKLLLKHGADVHSRTLDGWQPLHSACKWDSVECASLLLKNGANINSTTNGNQTPLHLAASNNEARKTLELLLSRPNIIVDLKNDSGDTALDIALRSGRLHGIFEMCNEEVISI